MSTLSFDHWLAENIDVLCKDLLPYLEKKLECPIDVVTRKGTEYREDTPFVWLCGLLYTHLRDGRGVALEPLVAPIFEGERAAEYSSYLVVAESSPYQGLSDLQGKRLAFNEEGSFSGYHILRYCLKDTGLQFELVESGGHAHSLDFVGRGDADVAAIDTSFFDYLRREHPTRLAGVRVLERLPNFPAPPLLTHVSLPSVIKEALANTLLVMHSDAQGQTLLRKHAIQRFVRVNDAYYNDIRNAFRKGRSLAKE